MKIFLQILFIAVAIVSIVYLLFYSAGRTLAPGTHQNINNKVCFGSHCFFVELAKTEGERERGLMDRTLLDKDKGMLFIFDKEGIYPFWMKNTLIPLDIIWLDGSGKVVFIGNNIQPCKSFICPSVIPAVNAKYVLEVNANIAESIGLGVGDLAVMNIK